MKVSDVMSKQVDFVSINTSVKDVCHLIFGRRINGVPVCKEKKVIGFITERDVLAKFYPSMQEYMEDPVHSADFEGMEKKVSEILALTADKIMSRDPITTTPDMPLLKAQSLMSVKKVGRIPVVDEKGNLAGIISKGDVFKSVVGRNLSLQEEEGFYDWLAKRYDTLIDWKTRLSKEIPDIESLFKKEKGRKILDVASSTGEHSIALAKKGFEVFGIESSTLMDMIAQSKKSKLSIQIQNLIHLFKGNYIQCIEELEGPLDAAIFMGNALSHVLYTDRDILRRVTDILRKENAIMVFQIVNFEKVFSIRSGLRDFTLRDNKAGSYYREYAFLGFYTKERKGVLASTRAIFSSIDSSKWSFAAINSTPVIDIRQKDLEEKLNKVGFSRIAFYGSAFNGPLFQESFKPLESDWLNVIARR